LTADLRLLEEARAEAVTTLQAAPDLDGPWAATREAMKARWAARLGLAQVG
jgi:hypothetical protein